MSPDPSPILRNGRKHPAEKLTDKTFFDKYSVGIASPYTENDDLEDDQEETSRRPGYGTESTRSMDIESRAGSMPDNAMSTREQVAASVNMAEQAGI